MKWFKPAILAAGILVCFSAAPVHAAGIWDACNGQTENTAICGDTNKTEAKGVVKNLINVFLYVIGILSVIMIIHSGLKYVNSRGDAEAIKSAKNTLLYAVIGVIVALMAFTIVNFVISAYSGGTQTQPPAGTSGPKP